MISIVYLVLVFNVNYNGGSAGAAVSIPQANMNQCLVNSKNYSGRDVKKTYYIVGVK